MSPKATSLPRTEEPAESIETVDWRGGLPRSPRFDDVYHSASGALAQARHVFLAGCGLPEAWAKAPQWRILETGFGLGINFLTSWQAWRADPQRPRLLHFVSIEAYPVQREDLLRATAAYPELAELAHTLAAQWHGLLPGLHRLVFDGGQVLLTLCIGEVQPMLRAQRFEADSIFLDGFSPQHNPQMWSPETLRSIARFARRGTHAATWSIARGVRDALAQNGFRVEKTPGLPPKRDCLRATFDPAWTPRRRSIPCEAVAAPGRCAVIGAGLAGAAVAASLARRGWQVTVLEAGGAPGAGASALPVGALAPHVSPDDALLSRLTRAGIRATWQQLETLLHRGVDWLDCGVLERRTSGDARLPAGWSATGPNESWHAGPARLTALGLAPDAAAIWHARAGWVRPAALIAAWLAQPGITVQCGRAVEHMAHSAGEWQLFDTHGELLAQAGRLVIAAGVGSRHFAPALPLQPVRGQIAWGHAAGSALPPCPINGDGHLIAHVPEGPRELWLAGSTFDRDDQDTRPRAADATANHARIERLHPGAAAALAPDFEQAAVHAWAGLRCASADRRPLVGPIDPVDPDGPWLCGAMGSRGLSFAALCAELLAARWHGEPLPISSTLAHALDTRRL